MSGRNGIIQWTQALLILRLDERILYHNTSLNQLPVSKFNYLYGDLLMTCCKQTTILILQKYIELLKNHPLPDFKERIHIAIKALQSDLLKEHGL